MVQDFKLLVPNTLKLKKKKTFKKEWFSYGNQSSSKQSKSNGYVYNCLISQILMTSHYSHLLHCFLSAIDRDIYHVSQLK